MISIQNVKFNSNFKNKKLLKSEANAPVQNPQKGADFKSIYLNNISFKGQYDFNFNLHPLDPKKSFSRNPWRKLFPASKGSF